MLCLTEEIEGVLPIPSASGMRMGKVMICGAMPVPVRVTTSLSSTVNICLTPVAAGLYSANTLSAESHCHRMLGLQPGGARFAAKPARGNRKGYSENHHDVWRALWGGTFLNEA